MSLPLLISLFLSALVGVFPAGAVSGTAVAPVVADRPSARSASVQTPSAQTPSAQTPSSVERCDDEPAAPATPPASRTAPASTGGTVVRALVDQDVQAARAPRAPPLRLG